MTLSALVPNVPVGPQPTLEVLKWLGKDRAIAVAIPYLFCGDSLPRFAPHLLLGCPIGRRSGTFVQHEGLFRLSRTV